MTDDVLQTFEFIPFYLDNITSNSKKYLFSTLKVNHPPASGHLVPLAPKEGFYFLKPNDIARILDIKTMTDRKSVV